MTNTDRFDERLRAVERALTDGDATLPEIESKTDLLRRVDELERRTGTIEDRLDELDAATQSLRGYVGNVRAVNRDVERRADAALAAAESVAEDTAPIPPAELGRSPEEDESDPEPGEDGGASERRLLSRLGGVL